LGLHTCRKGALIDVLRRGSFCFSVTRS
jgi:hypothetical protein